MSKKTDDDRVKRIRKIGFDEKFSQKKKNLKKLNVSFLDHSMGQLSLSKKKKGIKGEVSNYITRARAIRKLQIPLSDFRFLNRKMTFFIKIQLENYAFSKAFILENPRIKRKLERVLLPLVLTIIERISFI